MKLTKIISRLLDPLVILGGMTVIGIFQSGLHGTELSLFLTVFIIGSVLFPGGLLWWAIAHKKIGNWDITNRRQRFMPLSILIGCLTIDLALSFVLGNHFLILLFSLYMAYLVGFFLITLYWKISGHTGAVGLASGLLILRYGWNFWPVLLFVPLIVWARIKGKYHTRAQAIGGVIYAWALVYIFAALIR